MSPNSIAWFERMIFATLLLGVIQAYIGWEANVALASKADSSPVTFVLSVLIFTLVLLTALTLLVSRRRSKIAMWVSIALFALGLPTVIGIFASGNFAGLALVAVVQTIGQLIAYGLLFTPSARRWLNHEQSPDEVFS